MLQHREASVPPGPTYLPWVHGDAAEKQFLCDVSLGGLARQMRLFGIDAAAMPQRAKHERVTGIREMLKRGWSEQRVVLTVDRVAASARDAEHCYLVRAQGKREQLAEVVKRFAIDVCAGDIMSRCTSCSAALFDRTFTAAELPATCTVPSGIASKHERFWVCSACSKTYWQGQQYVNALDALTVRLASLRASSPAPALRPVGCATQG